MVCQHYVNVVLLNKQLQLIRKKVMNSKRNGELSNGSINIQGAEEKTVKG